MSRINVQELNNLLEKGVNVIDVRERNEFAYGRVPGAKNIPVRDIVQQTEQFLNKDETYYIICQSGSRSALVCQMIGAKGYDVIDVAGGTGTYGMMYNLEY